MLQSFIKGDFIHRQPGLLYIILIEYNLTMPHPISIPIGMGAYGSVKFDVKTGFIKYQITEKIMKIYSLYI